MITDLTIIFWIFCIFKSLADSLKHEYPKWKSRLGIPDKWDWWFDAAVSHQNKYKGFWAGIFTPFSDAWHTLWTIPQFAFVIYAIIKTGLISGLLVTGIGGVFVIFNGIYAFMRKKKFLKIGA